MPVKTLRATMAGIVLAATTGVASAESFRVDYSVSLLGLNIARSTFTSTINGDSFTVQGQLASSGIARIFDSTKGTAQISGAFDSRAARPVNYLVNYTSGDKKKKTEISFRDGAVVKNENLPPPRPNRKNWVDVSPADLKAVTDPLSGTMIRASSLEDVCNHTISIFDGELRADLRLSAGRIAPAEAKGFSGNAVTCQAKFVALGGYRSNNKSIRFLQNQSKIQISFAPMGNTGIYAPIRASATTEIGTIVVTANRFEAVE
ncbi:MAG: DUF3108 domain-containing protein [Mesorhizobium sp.]